MIQTCIYLTVLDAQCGYLNIPSMGNSTGHVKCAVPLHVPNDNSHNGKLVSSKYISYWLMHSERKP